MDRSFSLGALASASSASTYSGKLIKPALSRFESVCSWAYLEKGFAGERIEYKINCECRKPKPGMLLQAAGDFNIDLSSSWMVGDGRNDIEAGKSAGCKTILIGNEEFGQSVSVNSLKEFVDRYLE